MNSLSTLLKTQGVLLQNFSLKPQATSFEAELVVEVHNREELILLKETLKGFDGIDSVY